MYFDGLLFFCCLTIFAESHFDAKDYRDHVCNRDCNLYTKPMLCEYNFTIEWYTTLSKACYNCPSNSSDCNRAHCVAANGVERSVIVVNRMLPGPALEVCRGDVVSVNVFNNLHLAESTSIHWHGQRQRGTPFMDGAGMVTQCPILPHTSFEYSFVANDAGTHLWHSHSGLQRQDGAFGAFIVRTDAKEDAYYGKYDFDLSEHVIVVTDWLNETAIEKFAQHHHNNGNNKPDAMLINGKGVYYEYQKGVKRAFEVPRATFTVRKGYRYRFRLINAGSLYCPIQFSIDDHKLMIISTDGNDVEAVEVDALTIYTGERYDFVLTAGQTVKNYWIKTKGLADCSVNSVYQTAILNYAGVSANVLPTSKPFNYTTIDRQGLMLNPWNIPVDYQNYDKYIQVDELRSLAADNSKYCGKVDKKFFLSMEFNKVNNPEFHNPMLYSLSDSPKNKLLYTPQINNISMTMPPSPPLYQWDDIPKELICNQENRDEVCPSGFAEHCSCIHVIEVGLNDLVEFVMVDEGFTFQSNHPTHQHGYHFAVIGIDKINRSLSTKSVVEMDKRGYLKRNFDRPPLKDTVTVPVGGYTIVRLIADNPGAWLMHCHLEFHAEVGMAFILKVGSRHDLPREPEGWAKCGSFKSKDSSGRINFLDYTDKRSY